MERIALTFLLLVLPAAAMAGPRTHGWQLDLPVSLTSGSYFRHGADGTSRRDAVWAAAGVELSTRRGPWKGALFADRWFSDDAAFDGAVNAGFSVTRDAGRADWLAIVMNHRPQSGGDNWAWAGRVRYRVADRHKFGFEILGELDQPDRSRLESRDRG